MIGCVRQYYWKEGNKMDVVHIEQKAREVLMQNDLYEIPVDPVNLAKLHGIEVKNAIFKDSNISGIISKDTDKTIIFVNSVDPYNRKRFTVAHELGHYFLHLTEDNGSVVDMYRNSTNINNKNEVEANSFAAAILMDELLVKSKWNDLKSVQVIADIFHVSYEAMSYRLRFLELI